MKFLGFAVRVNDIRAVVHPERRRLLLRKMSRLFAEIEPHP
jgi:hypothetical protein